jgi:hypothetical protein
MDDRRLPVIVGQYAMAARQQSDDQRDKAKALSDRYQPPARRNPVQSPMSFLESCIGDAGRHRDGDRK